MLGMHSFRSAHIPLARQTRAVSFQSNPPTDALFSLGAQQQLELRKLTPFSRCFVLPLCTALHRFEATAAAAAAVANCSELRKGARKCGWTAQLLEVAAERGPI